MKKTMLLAVCLILAGLLAVNGTFALEETFTEVVNGIFAILNDVFDDDDAARPYQGGGFHVSLAYLDSDGNEVTDAALPQLLPGSTVERRTAVKNESSASESNVNSAYFCIAFAVQKDIADLLDFTINCSNYTWTKYDAPIRIDNTDYLLAVATYPEVLSVGEISPPALQSVMLSVDTTSEQISQFRTDFLQIQVLAIRADDFNNSVAAPMSAKDALNAALSIDSPDFNPFK